MSVVYQRVEVSRWRVPHRAHGVRARRRPCRRSGCAQARDRAAGRRCGGRGAELLDPRRRPERPDISRISIIRFLTEIDYPPFNYSGPDSNPAGLNVDLARALCEELKVNCTVQMRRFDTLVDSLTEKSRRRGDRVAGGDA